MTKKLVRVAGSMAALGLSVACCAQVSLQSPPAKAGAGARQDKIVAETPEAKKIKAENAQKAKELLQRAYGTAKDLSESDQAALLARMSQSAARVMPEQSRVWGDEVFRITQGLTGDNQRGQYEMTAMMAVAENDPDHAMQLLLQMSPPGTSQDGTQMMDLRGMAAVGLFQKYFQKKGDEGISTLQSTARQLGEQGLYPFMAMGPVIRSVGRNDPDKAQAMASEALTFVPRQQRSDASGQQLAMFLRTDKDFISKPVLKDVLSQLVDRTLAVKDDNSTSSLTTITTNGNTATIKGASNLMMFQLMPLIKEVDPEWAKKLEDQNEQLRNASIAQSNSPGGTNRIQMSTFMTSGGSGLPQGNPMDPMKAMQVDELAQKDPVQALKMSDEISDPVLRTATSVRLAGDLNNTDPEQAARLVKNAKEAMAQTPEPTDKLRILAGLAQAQSAMHDNEGLLNTMDQGFTLAEQVYRQSVDKNPAATITSRPGTDSLTRITGVGIKTQPTMTIEHIDKLGAPALQVMLLIAAAENLDPDMKATDSGFRIMIRN